VTLAVISGVVDHRNGGVADLGMLLSPAIIDSIDAAENTAPGSLR
jgi:hypothetical protein